MGFWFMWRLREHTSSFYHEQGLQIHFNRIEGQQLFVWPLVFLVVFFSSMAKMLLIFFLEVHGC